MSHNGLDPGDTGRIATDPAALEGFYRQHIAAMQRFVARRTADPWTAADLTADIFVAAIDGAGSYRPELGSPAAWLHGIARNVINAHARAQARELTAVGEVLGRRLLDSDSLARAQERIEAEQEARAVYDALAVLSESERAVVELVCLDGITITDAALVLGVKPVTARVRLHRARTRVHTHLDRLAAARSATTAPVTTQEVTS